MKTLVTLSILAIACGCAALTDAVGDAQDASHKARNVACFAAYALTESEHATKAQDLCKSAADVDEVLGAVHDALEAQE